MVNVVIPALNEEHYIGQLLKSLSRQTYRKFDVTVVDGNSRDKTLEIAKQYERQLPKLTIIQTPKRNVSYQRNLGARNGKARYIIFLDADVILHPHFLEQLLRDVKGRDIANCWLIPISKKPIDKLLYNFYNLVCLEFGKYVWPVGIGNNLFTTRAVFDKIGGFDESIKVWEDVDYVKRAIANGAEFAILRRPKIYASVRRFEMQGRLNYTLEIMKGAQYALRTGKMPNHIDYPMGLDYTILHSNKKKTQVLEKKLASYYKYYTKRIKTLLKELLASDLDTQIEDIKGVINTFKRFLKQL